MTRMKKKNELVQEGCLPSVCLVFLVGCSELQIAYGVEIIAVCVCVCVCVWRVSRERGDSIWNCTRLSLRIYCKVKIYIVSAPFLMSRSNIGSTSALYWYDPISSP